MLTSNGSVRSAESLTSSASFAGHILISYSGCVRIKPISIFLWNIFIRLRTSASSIESLWFYSSILSFYTAFRLFNSNIRTWIDVDIIINLTTIASFLIFYLICDLNSNNFTRLTSWLHFYYFFIIMWFWRIGIHSHSIVLVIVSL